MPIRTLATDVTDALGPQVLFGKAPFRGAARWSYVSGWNPFNIADRWPAKLPETLARKAAFEEAENTLAKQILLDLRNALANGGIAYLDAEGQQTDREASMLAFVSTKTVKGKLTGLNILRISEDEFLAFLRSWAGWLAAPRIRQALNQADPLAG